MQTNETAIVNNNNLDETQRFELIQFVSETLSAQDVEKAVQTVIKYMRRLFGADCVRIREVIPRPRSLRFIYEDVDNPDAPRRINDTVTYSREVWDRLKNAYAQGCFTYCSSSPDELGTMICREESMPNCLLQMPMYLSGEFCGTLDFMRFSGRRKWIQEEFSALKVCSQLIASCLSARISNNINNSERQLHDQLTGLLTQSAFTEKLDRELPDMLKKSPVALVYTDIRHFRYINEKYGYKKGDEMLKIAARTIYHDVAEKYPELIVCRVHSDHFASAAPIPAEGVASFSDFIARQNDILCRALMDCCPDIRIRMNTGICFINNENTDAATAVSNANLARKQAKDEHQHCPVVFTEQMMDEIKYQEFLHNELPKAIENHGLKVYYQPKINCADDSIYGAEALVRWQLNNGEFIYPDRFIPLFEKNGSIIDIDFYVYRQVFEYLRRRMDAGLPVVPISMNVSRVHFKENRIISYIEGLIDEYHIPADLLEFELTENIYIQNFNKASDFITECSKRKIKVSMDDFGSGYSSLNVMSILDIDTLKIDRVFLKNDELNESDKTVLEAMITMAKKLGMKVVCEGVETKSQSLFLKNANCDVIQGYYYGKPMSEENFSIFMTEKLNSVNKII